MLVKTDSKLVREAVAVGRREKRHFRPVAVAEPLDGPLFKEGWWFVPEEEDKSIIPLEAKRGVESLRKAGIPVVHTIVAHEAPRALTAPVVMKPKRDWHLAQHSMTALKVLGTILMAVTGVVTAVVGLMGFLVVGLLADPSYIAVCQDEKGRTFWIEVATWYD